MKSEVKIGDDSVEMSRVFDAPREKVFDAFKRVDLIQKWWGCAQTEKVKSTMDFRVGGVFTHVMSLEGGQDFPYSGKYSEIDPPQKIAWTTDFGGASSKVTIRFLAQGDQTKLVMLMEGLPGDFCKPASNGMGAGLDRLEELLGSPVEAVAGRA
jgi:uncharacterized protein YndB with AHSA1/START domain